MRFGPIVAALPPELDVAVVNDGPLTVLACGALDELRIDPLDARDPFSELDRLERGWWAGFCSYELGARVERVTSRAALPTDGRASVPDVWFTRFAACARVDRSGRATVVGSGAARRALEAALAAPTPPPDPPELRGWTSSLERDDYEAGVRAIQALIDAGECYQANLTRLLTCAMLPDPVALWCAVEAGNPAPHAAFLRMRDTAVVSASPERFLHTDGRHAETRPIKGTARSARALRASAKDHAENVMIVDLARNDLGRVCVPGTVSVPDLFTVERHPGLWHLVSTVQGELRPDVGFGGLVRAAFPPASVTGAPKPRVLQVIEDLEPVRRGVYCGAIGFIDTERDRMDLSVAIRTFTVQPEMTSLGVGAGITADSDPAGEWAETELKAEHLLHLAGREPGRTRQSPVPLNA